MTKLSQIRKTIARVQKDKYWQSSDCLYFFIKFIHTYTNIYKLIKDKGV